MENGERHEGMSPRTRDKMLLSLHLKKWEILCENIALFFLINEWFEFYRLNEFSLIRLVDLGLIFSERFTIKSLILSDDHIQFVINTLEDFVLFINERLDQIFLFLQLRTDEVA